MSAGGERSAEEREAARLERERRRAARGRSAMAPPAAGPVPPAIAPRTAPQPVAARPPQHLPEPEPERKREPEPERKPEAEPGAAVDPTADGNGHEAFEDAEAPAGTRRVTGLERSNPAGRREVRVARSPRRERPPRRPTGERRRFSRWGRILSLVAIVVALALIWFLIELFQPFTGSGSGSVTVTIPLRASAGQVGDLLAKRGVVASSFFFGLRATLAGDRGDLRAGTYHLKHGMPYGDVLKVLTTAPPAARTSELTIAEGDTRAKIAALLRHQHIRGNYLLATRSSPLLNPRHYGAPASLHSLEGFLFPSTYQLRDPIRVGALVDDQLRTFKQRFATVGFGFAARKHLTRFDVLTIASMVQGEAQTLHDMPLIASVIYNRLHDHMLLGIDATTRYATGNYTTPLTVSQLNSPSPYNTRVHPGLPLGPINNPGLAAIRAAAHPAQTDYLYFVAKPCGNGASVFTSNYAQFQRDVQQYQAARSQRGGNSPTHC